MNRCQEMEFLGMNYRWTLMKRMNHRQVDKKGLARVFVFAISSVRKLSMSKSGCSLHKATILQF